MVAQVEESGDNHTAYKQENVKAFIQYLLRYFDLDQSLDATDQRSTRCHP